ncbi:MAG: hypothetical protein SGILL_009147, partial [Bacillariaceae sp.]
MKFITLLWLLSNALAVTASSTTGNLRATSVAVEDFEHRRLVDCNSRCAEPGATGKKVDVNGLDLLKAINAYTDDPDSSPYGNVLNCWDTSGVTNMTYSMSGADNEPIG